MTSKRYLVTGGTGFIGSSIVKRLIDNGHRVRVLDDNSRGAMRRLAAYQGRFEMVGGDVRDPAAVSAAAENVDSVIHLAYVNGTEFFYSKPALVLEVGVKGMLNVLDACRAHRVPELILASSSEVYQSPPTVPTDETAPLIVPDVTNPRYSYGGGKIISELLAINYGREDIPRVLIFRPHNVYGPDMGWEHVLPQFALRMRKAAQENPGAIRFPIQGDGSETRAFIWIEDFTDGIMAMIAKGEHLGIYHVGTNEEVSIADLARMVGRQFGREVDILPGPLQKGSTLRRCPDITKLSKLGFEPATPLEKGVGDLVRWYDAHAHLAP
jgi:nucleoside-diphosphate-sugar epimerase